MEYRYKKYSPPYLSSLTTLLDNSFSIENKNKKGLISWKYFDEYLNDKTITYIAIDNKHMVVSHYANLPIGVMRRKKEYNAMICTDMCTAIDHRGKGLISQLSSRVYKDVTSKGYDFSVGFSNDDGIKVDKYASNYGYKIVGRFVRYFKVVVYRKKISLRLDKTTGFTKDLYNKSSEFYKIKKDNHYLTWRYIKKPNNEYDIYNIIQDEEIVGYVVLRFVQYKCYIYDLVTKTDEKSLMITVLRSIENKAMDLGIRIIIYNVLDNSYWMNLFNRYKYFKKETNLVNYYLTIKIHNQKVNSEQLLNKENWLIMNGDIL